jgi:hypothetical protein
VSSIDPNVCALCGKDGATILKNLVLERGTKKTERYLFNEIRPCGCADGAELSGIQLVAMDGQKEPRVNEI